MSIINLKEDLNRMKEEEEIKLSELRQRRIDQEKFFTREAGKQNDEEQINTLLKEKDEISQILERMKRKNFELKVEVASWERVTESKRQEVKEMEVKLDAIHERIWKSREEFCSYVNYFLEEYEDFLQPTKSMSDVSRSESTRDECAINDLKIIVVTQENEERNLCIELKKLEKEKQRLLDEPNGPEYKRLAEWIDITRNRCLELEWRIAQKKREKYEEGLMLKKNNLFSIVSLEDVKKFSLQEADSNSSSFK